jgi:hypothetical protein
VEGRLTFNNADFATCPVERSEFGPDVYQIWSRGVSLGSFGGGDTALILLGTIADDAPAVTQYN